MKKRRRKIFLNFKTSYLHVLLTFFIKVIFNKHIQSFYLHSSTCFRVFIAGALTTFAGWHLLWCSLTMHFSWSTLFWMQAYVRVNSLNEAWIDSMPCSPSNPKPVLYFFIHLTTWSSKKCNLGVMEDVGKKVRYRVINTAISWSG